MCGMTSATKQVLKALSDEALVERWLAGTQLARDVLLARYDEKFAGFFDSKVAPPDADDLRQKALDVLSGLRERAEPLTGTVRGFAFGIARMLLRSYCSKKAGSRSFDPEVDSLVSLDPSISRDLSRHRHVQWLRAALEELPLETLTLIDLRYMQELTYPEIAEICQLPIGTVKSRIRLAKAALSARHKATHNAGVTT